MGWRILTTAPRSGKPELGTIRLTAAHQRGGIVIRIQDDGRGLDRSRILAKALDRGLVKTDANLTESEIFSLIFQPGFSTAEKVTDLSGRGVGMDVVRRNIENLARQGRDPIATWTGHDLHYPPSTDPCHYRRIAGGSGWRALHHSHALRPRVLQTFARHGQNRPRARRSRQRAGPADAAAPFGPLSREELRGQSNPRMASSSWSNPATLPGVCSWMSFSANRKS